MKPGKAVHPSNGIGTAPDAATTPGGVSVSFDMGSNKNRQTTSKVIITNLEAAQTLEVSFANGRDSTFFAIAPNTTVTIDVMTHSCNLRGTSGGTAAYSIMGVIA